ncbi:MAG: low molecular weight phosphatase family protein [Mycobacteriales bacterium]
MSEVFRILHVCTGNICRSPMAERLTRAGLQERLGPASGRFVVDSAGTWGQAGAPMEPYALSTLQSVSLDGTDFRARELVAEHVARADLVLGATREHRAAAVVLHPRAAARSFTLREFDRLTGEVEPAQLTASDPVERARELVRAAAGRRGLVPPGSPRDDDLADPYQGPEHGFTVCGDLVRRSLQRPLDLIAAAVESR